MELGLGIIGMLVVVFAGMAALILFTPYDK